MHDCDGMPDVHDGLSPPCVRAVCTHTGSHVPVEVVDEVEKTEVLFFGLEEIVDHVRHARHPGGLLNLPQTCQTEQRTSFVIIYSTPDTSHNKFVSKGNPAGWISQRSKRF